MARVLLSRAFDTIRSLRGNPGKLVCNPSFLNESHVSQRLQSIRGVHLKPILRNPAAFISCQNVSLKPFLSILQVVRGVQLTAVRTNVRCHFPRAKEHKRIKTHGWKTRISTPNGRKIIMRRILKGRHVLTH